VGREGNVVVNGVPVAFEERGDGAPVVVIHGWSADRRYMQADLEPVFEQRGGWRRIYLDLPGHGRTPAPDWFASQDDMLAAVQGAVDQLVPAGPVAVVGNSYGGYLALMLARTMPARLRGVAMLVPDVPDLVGGRETEPSITVHPDPDIFDDLADDEGWIPSALVRHERRMLEAIRADDMPAYRAADYGFLARLEQNYLPSGPGLTPGPPFTGPSLILCGRQDSTTGFRSAARLVDEFPRATCAVVDLAGHHLGRVERPAVFRALVDDWLDRMELEMTHQGQSEA
jgi:pimeloyl-ACP methyl ester carboxylesterase